MIASNLAFSSTFRKMQTSAIVGILEDDANPMVNVMKLDKAPKESYADIGGLDQQIQEIKVRKFWDTADIYHYSCAHQTVF